MEFGISMGLLAPTFKEQIEKQGLKISEEKAKEMESYKEAMFTLYFNDLLSESQMKSVEKKLFTRIKKAVTVPKTK